MEPEHRATLPAVTHVDGKSRLQRVLRNRSPLYYDLIARLGQATSSPNCLFSSGMAASIVRLTVAGKRKRLDRKKFSAAVFISVSIALMTVVFYSNPLGLVPFRYTLGGRYHNFNVGGRPYTVENLDEDSGVELTSAIVNTKRRGLLSNGLFLGTNEEPYLSQSGLHGAVLSVLFHFWPFGLTGFIAFTQFVYALALAATLSAFLYFVLAEFGTLAAGSLLLLLLFSDWLVFFAHNLHYATFLTYLPFVVAWFAYPKVAEDTRARTLFFVGVGFLVFLKALCGYEYATNVILGPTIAVVYFDRKNAVVWRETAKRVMRMTAWGFFGCLLAIGVHWLQLSLYFGSFGHAAEYILGKLGMRTHGQVPVRGFLANPEVSNLPPAITHLPRYVLMLGGYAVNSIVSVPLGWGRFLHLYLFCWVLAYGAILALWFLRVLPLAAWEERKQRGLLWATAWSAVCSSSWLILFKGNVYNHFHNDTVIFYLPWLVTSYALFGLLLTAAGRKWRLAGGLEPATALPVLPR